MTGHKAHGATTGRSFVVVDGPTDREWAYVAMSRGRQGNTLYLANPEPIEHQCTYLTHTGSQESVGGLTASLNRSSAQIAVIDQIGPKPGDDIDAMPPPPPSSDVAARVAWQIAKRQAERESIERRTPGLDLAAGR